MDVLKKLFKQLKGGHFLLNKYGLYSPKDLFSEKNSKMPQSDHDSLLKISKDSPIQLKRISNFKILKWLIQNWLTPQVQFA